MSTFSVKVRTENGSQHEFDQIGNTSDEVRDAAAERFGYLCYVMVRPK